MTDDEIKAKLHTTVDALMEALPGCRQGFGGDFEMFPVFRITMRRDADPKKGLVLIVGIAEAPEEDDLGSLLP